MRFALLLVALLCEKTLIEAEGPKCDTPDDLNGYCVDIKKCLDIYDESIKRKKDPEFVKYIQQSNRNCNYEKHEVCCPYEAPKSTSVLMSPTTMEPTTQSKATTIKPRTQTTMRPTTQSKAASKIQPKPQTTTQTTTSKSQTSTLTKAATTTTIKPKQPQNLDSNLDASDQSEPSRLATPDQCGVSKVPHNRAIGYQSKKGLHAFQARQVKANNCLIYRTVSNKE